MILQICAVYDKKVLAYTTPNYFRTKGEAIRSFMDACLQENHPFQKHSFDYTFCLLGTYDDSTGKHFSLEIPEILLDAAAVILEDEKPTYQPDGDALSPKVKKFTKKDQIPF